MKRLPRPAGLLVAATLVSSAAPALVAAATAAAPAVSTMAAVTAPATVSPNNLIWD